MTVFHDQLRAYVEDRGCVFERMTAKGRWRYLLVGRYPIEIPADTDAYNARQWGNIKELAKREIDSALRRGGERPDRPNPVLTPTAFHQAPLEAPAPAPAPVVHEEPEPLPSLPADDTLDAVIAEHFALTSGNGGDMAKAKIPSRKGRKLKGQPCPVAGCGKPALGKHIQAHIKRGELPKDFKLTYSRRPGVDVDGEARAQRRVKTVAVTAGPTSKRVKELAEAFGKGWDTIVKESEHLKRIVSDMLKLATDQEATLRLVEDERDSYKSAIDGMQQAFSRIAKPRTVTK